MIRALGVRARYLREVSCVRARGDGGMDLQTVPVRVGAVQDVGLGDGLERESC